MNNRTAFVIALKASALAELTGCTVDESIRYLAAKYTYKTFDLVSFSQITGLPIYKLMKFKGADDSMTMF